MAGYCQGSVRETQIQSLYVGYSRSTELSRSRPTAGGKPPRFAGCMQDAAKCPTTFDQFTQCCYGAIKNPRLLIEGSGGSTASGWVVVLLNAWQKNQNQACASIRKSSAFDALRCRFLLRQSVNIGLGNRLAAMAALFRACLSFPLYFIIRTEGRGGRSKIEQSRFLLRSRSLHRSS